MEDNVTGMLVRSTATNWAKSSVLAVDAGTHLAAVLNIINEHMPNAIEKPGSDTSNGGTTAAGPLAQANGYGSGSPYIDGTSPQLVLSTGPFADFELPHTTAKANAAHFVRNLITTYLITHPHLDHISGFVINTAGFQHTSRPKRLAGLPSTIDAFKTHIFNDIIWPNLSDEDGGVGLVSYMRLAEGGNLAIGEGEGRGYIEVCDGLAVKSWSVSHGKCMHNHQPPKHGNGSGMTADAFGESVSRRASQNFAMTPTVVPNHLPPPQPGYCVTDSSAFFLRDDHTGHEILIFGDVEPDSLSLQPRTAQVWSDAAPKIVNGLLKGILIECSYDESQSDETLFGHLAPRHVIEELAVLADKVTALRKGTGATGEDGEDFEEAKNVFTRSATNTLKRKRMSIGSPSTVIHDDPIADGVSPLPRRQSQQQPTPQQRSRRTSSTTRGGNKASRKKSAASPNPDPKPQHPLQNHTFDPIDGTDNGNGNGNTIPTLSTTTSNLSTFPAQPSSPSAPLEGVKVIIIHVKDNLKDGPEVGSTILTQLKERERDLFNDSDLGEGTEGRGLGCEFVISKSGTSVWL